jgi:hypothetical protein
MEDIYRTNGSLKASKYHAQKRELFLRYRENKDNV